MESCNPCLLEVGQHQMLLGVRWLADKYSSCSAVLRDSLFHACHVAQMLSLVLTAAYCGIGLGRAFARLMAGELLGCFIASWVMVLGIPLDIYF